MKSPLSHAVKVLVKKLSKDPDYYMLWQSNIAMAFKDECSRRNIGSKIRIHDAANVAAKYFLNLLILDVSKKS